LASVLAIILIATYLVIKQYLLAVITMEVDYVVPVYKILEELDKILEQTNLLDKKTKIFK